MRITRKIEMTVETSSTYVIRKSPSSRKIVCPKCGEPMLTAEQAAGMFDIKQRRIFQIIETGAAHFIETEATHFSEVEAGAVMICLPSLAEFLGGEQTIEQR